MPIEETIGVGLKLVLELVHILNPSELEKIEKEIHERRKTIEEKKKKLLEAVAAGDADAVNALTFGS